jgi:hypothetical protein
LITKFARKYFAARRGLLRGGWGPAGWLVLLVLAAGPVTAGEVSITGGVAEPGRYRTNGGKGVIALVLEAGGIANGCSEARVISTVEGKSRVFHVNLWELVFDFLPDWAPQPGDKVFITQHTETCLRDVAGFNALLREYIDARSVGAQAPAGWKKRLERLSGGCGKLHHDQVLKGRN